MVALNGNDPNGLASPLCAMESWRVVGAQGIITRKGNVTISLHPAARRRQGDSMTSQRLRGVYHNLTATYSTLVEPELVYCKPPEERLDVGPSRVQVDVCWRMFKLLPGRTIAATQWMERMTGSMKTYKSVQRYAATPQFFHAPQENLST